MAAALAPPHDRAARIAANPKKYFFKATVSGDVFLIKQLLDQGVCSWATKDDFGATGLHHAAFHGHLGLLRLLLETATNVDILDADECTPLHNAAFSGHVPCAEALLARGADVRRGDVDKATALHKAAHNGHAAMVTLLLQRGAPADSMDSEGLSALHRAAFRNAATAAAALLTGGAGAEPRDHEGATPLHIAAAEGAAACVALLLQRGAPPLLADRQLMLPLHFAAANGHLECVHELLSTVPSAIREAAVAARSLGGNTALHHAAAHGSVHCLSLLLRAGAELEALNARGSAPLHVAAAKRHVAAVRYLLQKGAQPLRPDQLGRTPRDLSKASARLRALFDAHLAGQSPPSPAPPHELPASASAPAVAAAVPPSPRIPDAQSQHQHRQHRPKKDKRRPERAQPRTLEQPVSTRPEGHHHRRTSSNDAVLGRARAATHEDEASSAAGTPQGTPGGSRVDPSPAPLPATTKPAATISGRGSITRSSSVPLKEAAALLATTAAPTGATPSSSGSAVSGNSASRDSNSSAGGPDTGTGSGEPRRSQSGALPRKLDKENYRVDRYGFVLKPKEAETLQKVLDPSSAHQYEAPALEEFDEAIKWAKLIGQHRSKPVSSDALSKMKRRCARGIPERVRGEAWKLLANAHVQRDPQLWAALLPQTSAADDEQIKRDLDRTLPEHSLFRERAGTGQQQLYLVLKAFSVHQPRVGYCQGMGFVAALLLIYLDAEDAFWLLCRLCEPQSRFGLAGLFAAGMPELPLRLDCLARLLDAHLPRVAAHLRGLGIDPTMYATQWFVTVFLYNHVPFPVVLRLWDLFLVYGYPIVFFFALTLFKTYEDKLLELQQFEEVLRLLKWDSEALRQHGLVMSPDQLVRDTLVCRKRLKSRFLAVEKAQREALSTNVNSNLGGGSNSNKEKDKLPLSARRDSGASRASVLTGPYVADAALKKDS